MEVVGDGDDFFEMEGFPRVAEGEQSSGALVIGFHGVCWDSSFQEGLPHGKGFVVLGAAAIAAEDDATGFACVIERCCGIHSAFEEGVGLVVALFGGGAEDEEGGVGWDFVRFGGGTSDGAEENPEVCGGERRGGEGDEEKDYQTESRAERFTRRGRWGDWVAGGRGGRHEIPVGAALLHAIHATEQVGEELFFSGNDSREFPDKGSGFWIVHSLEEARFASDEKE